MKNLKEEKGKERRDPVFSRSNPSRERKREGEKEKKEKKEEELVGGRGSGCEKQKGRKEGKKEKGGDKKTREVNLSVGRIKNRDYRLS